MALLAQLIYVIIKTLHLYGSQASHFHWQRLQLALASIGVCIGKPRPVYAKTGTGVLLIEPKLFLGFLARFLGFGLESLRAGYHDLFFSQVGVGLEVPFGLG